MGLKYRTFEGWSVKGCLRMCLESGYMPSNIERVYQFRGEDKR